MKRVSKRLYKTQGRFWLSLVLTLPMALVLFVLLTGGDDVFSEPLKRYAFLFVWAMDVVLFFLMLYTGKTDRWRAVLFVTFALSLSVTFIVHMFEARGAMTFDNADLLECKVPFCHIVTTMVLIPAALSKSIIFPGSIDTGFANISMMLVLTFGALLFLGRGFCSWGCFYGGWDDGFSRILKKPKMKKLPSFLRWGGFAVLIVVALTSATALVPTYCDWVCPFKTVTEFEAVTDFESGVKAFVFAGLFSGLVVVLPLLTKKRSQCAWFCPMGAFCSMSNAVNMYDVRIRKETCIRCGKCIKACPVQALDVEALDRGRAHINCLKCGKCSDVCPHNSIGYHIRWTRVLQHPTTARILYLYVAFGFLAVFSGGTIQQFLLLGARFLVSGEAAS